MEKIPELVRELLAELGEDPRREGLQETPRRVAELYRELTQGYRADPWEIVGDAIFEVEYDSMVVLRDVEYFSLCVHGRDTRVYTHKGARRASRVQVGDRVWTVVDGVPVQTQVVHVHTSKRRQLLEIETPVSCIGVTPEHPLLTPKGWCLASQLGVGDQLLYLQPSTLARAIYPLAVGYELGYVLGALASDGCITGSPPRYVRLQVKERRFAEKFRDCLQRAFPGLRARVETVWGFSGFRRTRIRMYRVRVTSSHVAQVLLQLFGGQKKTKSFSLPAMVRTSLKTMQGFLDGYIDGDGFPAGPGFIILSSNRTFLEQLGEVIHSTPSPVQAGGTSKLYISRRWHRPGWYKKGGFTPQETPSLNDPRVSWQPIRSIRKRTTTKKRFLVVNFECQPHPSYLANGFVAHNCEHHLIPFFGHVHVGYIPKGKVIGASKIPRIVDVFAHRLQLQERMTEQIAQFLEEAIQPLGLGVVVEGYHLCLAMRGVRKQDAWMVTSAMKRSFRTDARTRMEFLQFIEGRRER